MSMNFEDLPDTITPEMYAKWRGIGKNKAREKFNAESFPKLNGVGTRLLADKRAVLMYDLNITPEDYSKMFENNPCSNQGATDINLLPDTSNMEVTYEIRIVKKS